jgi:hypothetical protein
VTAGLQQLRPALDAVLPCFAPSPLWQLSVWDSIRRRANGSGGGSSGSDRQRQRQRQLEKIEQ